jgi:hypothetical protein
LSDARFAGDENLPGPVLRGLHQRGFDIVSFAEAGRLGIADELQLVWAKSAGRVILTHDRDYVRLGDSGEPHAGVGYCMQRKYHLRHGPLIERIAELFADISAEDWANRVVFL